MSTATPRILTGIQPSGALHLGNYFGAVAQCVALQEQSPGECFFFIADYHALTTVQEPAKLREYVRDVALTYLAFGVDPSKATLFRQSDVPEVTELTWLLSTVTGMGLLERGVSYKDKLARGLKPSVGLFTYPVLMAADILVYDSDVVPVGRDQVQHIEFAQDMATHFNETFGAGEILLRRPEPRIQSETAYIPGIDGHKMSKSYGNTIPLFLAGKPLRKVLGGIVTDSTPLGTSLPWQTCNVFALIKLFASPSELEDIRGWYEAGTRSGQPFGYGHAKLLLGELIEQRFAPARARRAELEADPAWVERVLADAAARARGIAASTLARCKYACGLAG